ncbi:MAG: hypothetical protein ACREMP_11565 [Candidatus Tyrphobacter sp.]
MTTALVLTPARLAFCARVAEHAAVRSLIAHLVVLCSLLPQSIAGEIALRCQRLYVRLPMRVRAADLEDERSRAALLDLARRLSSACEDAEEEVVEPSSSPRLVGDVASDRVKALVGAMESEPLGSAVPWVFAAEILGTRLEYRGAHSEAPAVYRALLIDVLTALAEQSPQIFRRRLVSGTEPALWDALHVMLDAAMGASALAASKA